jgi:hypothetical protein
VTSANWLRNDAVRVSGIFQDRQYNGGAVVQEASRGASHRIGDVDRLFLCGELRDIDSLVRDALWDYLRGSCAFAH